MASLLTVAERVDVLVLTAAESRAAVHHREHHRGEAGGSYARQQVVVDEHPGQDGRVGQGRVQLGEVEEQPEEDQRDAEYKYPEYEVEC